MRVVTFYSYKGGVGRTLACANYGLYAARTGQKVVLMDMDFEAPGLDSKFDAIAEDKARFLQHGLIDQFSSFQAGLEIPQIKAIEIPLPDDVSGLGGRLHLVPAGDYTRADYFGKLSDLNWSSFVSDQDSMAFCLDLIRRIAETFQADLLVIDSRTGLTEVGGLCTQVLPDTVIMLTSMSKESVEGTRRIYQRIEKSPIVKSRSKGRTSVDLRVVVARIPRPDELSPFDVKIQKKIALPVERLYYLFDQRDLSIEDYLAMDRFSRERPAILDDYVELFASLKPETNLDYIDSRLEVFRSGITQRPPDRNEQIIQELLMLFPLPVVFLEAARYYRIVKDDAHAIVNYLRYLGHRDGEENILNEFAEVCASVEERTLKPTNEIANYLKAYGIHKMIPDLLQRYAKLITDEGSWHELARAIEDDEEKAESAEYRPILVEALQYLGEWEKVLEISDDPYTLLEAHASLGNAAQVKKQIPNLRLDDFNQAEQVLHILFKALPQEEPEALAQLLLDSTNRHLLEIVVQTQIDPHDEPSFLSWKRRLKPYVVTE